MRHRLRGILLWGVLGVALSLGTAVWAEEESQVFQQPEDPQETLRSLDDIVLQKQKALFAARMRGNPEEIKKAQEEFEAVQKQRSQAVRAMEQRR